MYKPHFFSQNWSQKSRVRLIHGYICVWSSLAIHEFFQAISFHIREQLNTESLVVFYYLHGKFVNCIIRPCSAWSFSPIAGFQTSLYTWYSRTAASTIARPWPRLLPTFKAWLLSTCLFIVFQCRRNFNFMACFEVIILKNRIERAF